MTVWLLGQLKTGCAWIAGGRYHQISLLVACIAKRSSARCAAAQTRPVRHAREDLARSGASEERPHNRDWGGSQHGKQIHFDDAKKQR